MGFTFFHIVNGFVAWDPKRWSDGHLGLSLHSSAPQQSLCL